MKKLLECHKEDPAEELEELYEYVTNLQDRYAKSIQLAKFLQEKHS